MEKMSPKNRGINAEEKPPTIEHIQDYSYQREVMRPTHHRSFNVSLDDPYVSKFSAFIGNEDAAVIPDTSHPPNFALINSTTPSRDQQILGDLPRNCEPNLQVELLDRELWEDFSSVGTEMIVTKAGRRMFPGYRVRLDGLDPNAHYCVFMDIVNVDQHRYKFQGGEWMVAGKGEHHLPRRMFLHPDSPSCGRKWMSDLVSFNKIKLTNSNTAQAADKIILNSMHRYQPRIHIVKTSDVNRLDRELKSTFAFPQTVFITVTAYQNGKVTKLKINNNPFAKGFRDNGARTSLNNNKNLPPTKRQKSDKSNNSGGQQSNSGKNLNLETTSSSYITNPGESATTSHSNDQSDNDFLLHFPLIAKKEPRNYTRASPNIINKEDVWNYNNSSYHQLSVRTFHNTAYNTRSLDQTVPYAIPHFNNSQQYNGLRTQYLPIHSQFLPHFYEPFLTHPTYTMQNSLKHPKPTASSSQPNTLHSVYNMLHADTAQYKSSTNIFPTNKMYAF